ncbi:hypothetical protein BGZ58_000244, partial [Dissophora ornata]
MALPFLTDKNSQPLNPLRVLACLDVVLDVVLQASGDGLGPESKRIEDSSDPSSKSPIILDSPQSSPVAESSRRSTYTNTTEENLKSANQGDADAQSNLGFMYDNGKGVPQDYPKAIEWYLKATNQGDAIAQSNLGF